jgi:hypothetical protein
LGGGSSGGPGDWWYGPFLGDMTGASCAIMGTTYGQMFFPDSPGVIGPVLSARVERGEIPRARIINGRWYSPALGMFLNGSSRGEARFDFAHRPEPVEGPPRPYFQGKSLGFSLLDYLSVGGL